MVNTVKIRSVQNRRIFKELPTPSERASGIRVATHNPFSNYKMSFLTIRSGPHPFGSVFETKSICNEDDHSRFIWKKAEKTVKKGRSE